jgi:LysR family transcriptional regulator, glycine cleavage system transcriptional activator
VPIRYGAVSRKSNEIDSDHSSEIGMNPTRTRALNVGPLRAFEAVARRLNFRMAAEDLSLTQSAISRQIKSLEDDLGAALFSRGTRHVELTPDGILLLRSVAPLLQRMDASVRQIRQARGRKVVNLNTFASFASMWLIPQMQAFQRAHPDIDIRVSATDRMVDVDEPDIDLILRYGTPQQVPVGAQRMFGEVLTPVIGRGLAEQIRRGEAPALKTPADLAAHTLTEEDDNLPSAEFLSWRHWLGLHGQPQLQPRRWLYMNFTYQQVQAALTGQGVALARVALVAEALASGDLVEPFGVAGRVDSHYAYWLIASSEAAPRAEVSLFCEWVLGRAEVTRGGMGEG